MNKLKDIEPIEVLRYFEDICSIPHGSGNTKQISDYCVNFAKQHNLEYYQDSLNNVIIKKPAYTGYENAKPLLIQGHLDMVCEKTQDCTIDFEKDGLNLYIDGDFIKANGTTLGGDDGIAIAYSLAILSDENLPHPALEALFTVDEETGMYGAIGIDESKINATTILNIDSENEGIFTVGCAGGARTEVTIPVKTIEQTGVLHTITLSNLTGGHSGVEIDKHRANANKVMGEILSKLMNDNIYLTEFEGGLKTNVIPAFAKTSFICETDISSKIKDVFAEISKKYNDTDPNMKIEVSTNSDISKKAVFNSADIINFICDVPDGVISMSKNISSLVETSSNFGITSLDNSTFTAQFLIRSLLNKGCQAVCDEISTIGKEYGGESETSSEYPAWEYKENSYLIDKMCETFEKLYNKQPEIVTIHAGLECGIFAKKIPDMDCVSIGPDLFDIHTPDERMSISSVKRTWEFIKLLLKDLK